MADQILGLGIFPHFFSERAFLFNTVFDTSYTKAGTLNVSIMAAIQRAPLVLGSGGSLLSYQ